MSISRNALVALLLAGCASSSPRAADGTTAATHPENSGGERAHHGGHEQHHQDLPAPVTAYHDVLAPLWHSDAGAARDGRTCEQSATLRDRATAVQSAPVPERAQAREAAWRAAATQLSTASEGLVAACAATPRGNVAGALETAHTAFHALLESLGQGHH